MRFAIVARDELWRDGVLRDERLSWGEAVARESDIVASDTLDEALLPLVQPATPLAAAGDTVRRVITARRAGRRVIVDDVIVVRRGDLSVVTTPAHFDADERLLRALPAEAEVTIDYRDVPLLWRSGSGAVLLHEAAGHPAEHRKRPVVWPAWLSVTDEPPFDTDDIGRPVIVADLLAGDEPSARRRASFVDVPLPRLSNVVVRHRSAPFALPDPRVDVSLVGGGTYDPLTDRVSVTVAGAVLVEGGCARRVAPFTIDESREAVARSIRGANGEPQRYPGVICSSEGQEIFVASHAPDLLTWFADD